MSLFNRAFGVLLGQCVGDALGAQVEFEGSRSIRAQFPNGVREMTGGGPFNLAKGQITDDSELALSLARSLRRCGKFDADNVAAAYIAWAASSPFDMGGTTSNALRGDLNPAMTLAAQIHLAAMGRPESEANGALMRVSPLALVYHAWGSEALLLVGREDAALTHANPFCQIASGVFLAAIGALLEGATPEAAYRVAIDLARRASTLGQDPGSKTMTTLMAAAAGPPSEVDGANQGWVRHALHNAFYRLLRSKSFEDGVVDTIGLGGDTDTNAAIAGALLGAKFGAEAIPVGWKVPVMLCESPRPMDYRTWDLEALTRDLLLSAERS